MGCNYAIELEAMPVPDREISKSQPWHSYGVKMVSEKSERRKKV